MSKILLISDTHRDNEVFFNILNTHRDVTLRIHAGDSCLEKNDPLLAQMLVVKGNHDFVDFPEYLVYPPYFICHGHTFHIYQHFDEVVSVAKKYHCHTVIHGHTHIAFDALYEGIRIINPGSAMFNRGSYGYGTYAVLDDQTQQIHFYHHLTHEDVTDVVLPDGQKTLAEFREFLQSI